MDYELTQPEGQLPRLAWVDFMRFVAAFLIVLAHIDVWGGGPDWAQKIYYTISRNGVPLFFLVSGYLLLSKQEGLWTFFRKRVLIILIPFLIWSIVYDVFFTNSFGEAFTLDAVLKLFIRILRGPRAAGLWFFYAMIGLYLFTPILRIFISRARSSDVLYYIALWVLAMPVMFIVDEFTPIQNGFELYYAMGYVGYCLLGAYLGRLETTPRLVWVAIGLFAVGALITFSVFYFNLAPQNNELPFRSYPSLNILVMAIGVFLLLKTAGERMSARLTCLSNWASQSAFGIYLIHSILLSWMASGWEALGFQTTAGNSLLVIPLAALINFLLSWGVTALMRKIPLVRATVP